MKINREKINIQTFGVLSESAFGISNDDQAHILGILRDKLYTDKIMAFLREYSTNAVDAHIEAGIPERPIKVLLPTTLSPKCAIRDYGLGLSEEDIRLIYTQYGKSTKRNSNEVIGQLGLGCKSGFAYTNSFNIISIHQGTRTIYHAYIDASSIGKVAKISTTTTEEESGIEIIIPIQTDDIIIVRQKAFQCFQYFDIKPVLNEKYLEIPQTILYSGRDWKILKVERQRYSRNSYMPMAIMGNIGYPIESIKINLGKTKLEAAAYGACLQIRFPIGSLSIAANREHLEYTNLTQETIQNKIQEICIELQKDIKTQLAACETPWERKKHFIMSKNKCQYGSLSEMIITETAQANYPGLNLQPYLNIRSDLFYTTIYTDKVRRPIKNRTIYIGDEQYIAIFVDDVKSQYLVKTRTLLNKLKTMDKYTIFIIRQKDPNVLDSTKPEFLETINAVITQHNIQGIPVHKLSEITKEDLKTQKRTQQNIRTSKPHALTTPVLQLKSVDQITTTTRPSLFWEQHTIDPNQIKQGVYVLVHALRPSEPIHLIQSKLRALRALNLNYTDITIYGLRQDKKYTQPIPDGWLSFTKYYRQAIKDISSRSQLIRSWIKGQSFLQKMDESKFSSNAPWGLVVGFKNNFKNKNNAFLQLAERVIDITKSKTINSKTKYARYHMLVRQILQNDYLDSINADTTTDNYIQTIQKQYPLITTLTNPFYNQRYGRYKEQKQQVQILIDYCNLVDSQEE
jgi:hypothetical protein